MQFWFHISGKNWKNLAEISLSNKWKFIFDDLLWKSNDSVARNGKTCRELKSVVNNVI